MTPNGATGGLYQPQTVFVDMGALCHRAAKLLGNSDALRTNETTDLEPRPTTEPRLRNGVKLKFLVPNDSELRVYSDPTILLQFLTNLLSNAVKFTPS